MAQLIVSAMLLALLPSLAIGDGLARYNSLEKGDLEHGSASSLRVLREASSGFPKLFMHRIEVSKKNRYRSTIDNIAEAVVRLEVYYRHSNSTKECTATHIGSDLFVTASHCLFDRENPPDKAKVTLNYEEGFNDGVRQIGIDINSIYKDNQFDFSTFIAPNAATYLSSISRKYRPPASGETLLMISHPYGQKKRVSTGTCTVSEGIDSSAPIFAHTCSSLPSSSGAVLIAATDGSIVGVHFQQLEGGSRLGVAYANLSVVRGNKRLGELVSTPSELHRARDALGAEEAGRGISDAIAAGEYSSDLMNFILDNEMIANDPSAMNRIRVAILKNGRFDLATRKIFNRSQMSRDHQSQLMWWAFKWANQNVGSSNQIDTRGELVLTRLLEFNLAVKPKEGYLPCDSPMVSPDISLILREYSHPSFDGC